MNAKWIRAVEDLSPISQIAADGFDGVRLNIGRIMELSDKELAERKRLLDSHNLSVEVCASPLPPKVRVTEQGFNLYVWTDYVKTIVHRVAQLDCRTIAWSDGRARVLPVEGDVSGLKEQMLQFVALFCEVAAQRNIRILIEPLGPRKTNFLNTMDELADFVSHVGKKNLAAMIGCSEMSQIGMKDAEIPRYAQLIGLVHLENPLGESGLRSSPAPKDGYDYRPFFHALRVCRYAGAFELPEDAGRKSLQYCRDLWTATSQSREDTP